MGRYISMTNTCEGELPPPSQRLRVFTHPHLHLHRELGGSDEPWSTNWMEGCHPVLQPLLAGKFRSGLLPVVPVGGESGLEGALAGQIAGLGTRTHLLCRPLTSPCRRNVLPRCRGSLPPAWKLGEAKRQAGSLCGATPQLAPRARVKLEHRRRPQSSRL